MQPIVGQAETHQNRRNTQVFGEIADDGNRASAADEHGLASKNIREGTRGYIDGVMIRVHRNRWTRAQYPDLRLDPGGGVVLDELLVSRDNFLRILIRHHAHADLGACRCKASSDAVYFERRPGPGALEDVVAGLAGETRGADLGLQKFL